MSRLAIYLSLASAAVAGLLVWEFQGARMQARVAELQMEAAQASEQLAQEQRASDRRAFQTAQAVNDQYAQALNDAITRNAALQAAATRAAASASSLRKQLDEAHARLVEAPAAAVREYAATANKLLGACSQRYTELARRADGHAADARACREAWPVITSTQEKQ